MDKDFEIWKRERAEGIILSYLQGLRKVSLNWALGCLKGNFGLSKKEILLIVKKIIKSALTNWKKSLLKFAFDQQII